MTEFNLLLDSFWRPWLALRRLVKWETAISFNHMIKSRPIEKMLSGKDEFFKKMLNLSRSGWGGRAVAVAFRRSHLPFSEHSDFLHRKKVLSGFLVSHNAIYK